MAADKGHPQEPEPADSTTEGTPIPDVEPKGQPTNVVSALDNPSDAKMVKVELLAVSWTRYDPKTKRTRKYRQGAKLEIAENVYSALASSAKPSVKKV